MADAISNNDGNSKKSEEKICEMNLQPNYAVNQIKGQPIDNFKNVSVIYCQIKLKIEFFLPFCVFFYRFIGRNGTYY